MCRTAQCCYLWYLVCVAGSVSAAIGRQSECKVLVYTTKACGEVEVQFHKSNLGSRWQRLTSCTTKPPYRQGNDECILLSACWVGPKTTVRYGTVLGMSNTLYVKSNIRETKILQYEKK